MSKDEPIDLRDSDETTAEVLRKSLSLIDGEHQSGELSDDQYALARSRYLSFGAELLDDQYAEAEKSKDKGIRVVGQPKKTRNTAVVKRAVVWTILGVLVISITASVLLSNKSNRQSGASVSGNVVQSNEDILAKADAAQQKGDLAGALKLYDQVLRTDPKNIDALASRGWTLYIASTAIGDTDPSTTKSFVTQARQALDKAVALDPTYAPALAWRGIVRFRAQGDAAGAVQDFDAYLAQNSNDGMRTLVQSVRDEAAKSTSK